MKIKILIFLITLLITDAVIAQSDSLLNLTRKITYYENGQPKKLVTYLNDSCEYFDDYRFSDYNDYCREGFYQEWFSNGQIMISGQYKYEWCYDTILVANPISGELDTTIVSFKASIKTGLWDTYDTIGNRISTSRYINDRLVAIRQNRTDTTIRVSNDSLRIKIKDYSSYSTYLINRTNNNKSLVIQFPTHGTHNYWKIYDYKKVDLLIDDYPITHIFDWDKALIELWADDCHTPVRYFYDFATLPSGKYYVYYWSFHGVFHEIKIILNDV